MPELPEVQTVVNDLKQHAFVGQTFIQAELFWTGCIVKPSSEEFCQQVKGQTILAVTRRGKWIVIGLQDLTLLIHLRMSGRLILNETSRASTHERMRLTLSDGRVLRFEDQRKFGTVHLLQDPQEKLAKLGVEPLSDLFTADYLTAILRLKRTKIKAQLLDQTFIAGLGNIYVDEALWHAQIHPQTPCFLLKSVEIERLCKAIRDVLHLGIINKGTSLGEGPANFRNTDGNHGQNLAQLSVYQRKNQPCMRCAQTIEKIIAAGRGTHVCLSCQVLAQF